MALAALTTALFLFNLRRAGKRPGVPPNASKPGRKPIQSTARYSIPPPAVLLIVTLWLSACATAGSDGRAPCPPVVDYPTADQTRAAVEVEALLEDAVIVPMLGDYAVLRDQAHAFE